MSGKAVALASQDGWHSEGTAARVHYEGAGERYSIEYYEPEECVLYWRVHEAGETAHPVDRESVPGPLRDRIRQNLATADIDPDVERRTL